MEHIGTEVTATGKPLRGKQGPGSIPMVAKVGGGGGSHRNRDRRRHAARGADTSGGGWRVAVVGDFQVVGASLRERIWRAGENERGL